LYDDTLRIGIKSIGGIAVRALFFRDMLE